MAMVLFEVLFGAGSLKANGFEGRDEIEDPLDDALLAAELGEVTGGGGGVHGTNIDIEVDDNRLDEALTLVRRVLRQLNVPRDTIIRQLDPVEKSFSVFD